MAEVLLMGIKTVWQVVLGVVAMLRDKALVEAELQGKVLQAEQALTALITAQAAAVVQQRLVLTEVLVVIKLA